MILLTAQGCSRNEITQLTGLRCFSHPLVQAIQELCLQDLVDLPGRGRTAGRSVETNP